MLLEECSKTFRGKHTAGPTFNFLSLDIIRITIITIHIFFPTKWSSQEHAARREAKKTA